MLNVHILCLNYDGAAEAFRFPDSGPRETNPYPKPEGRIKSRHLCVKSLRMANPRGFRAKFLSPPGFGCDSGQGNAFDLCLLAAIAALEEWEGCCVELVGFALVFWWGFSIHAGQMDFFLLFFFSGFAEVFDLTTSGLSSCLVFNFPNSDSRLLAAFGARLAEPDLGEATTILRRQYQASHVPLAGHAAASLNGGVG